MRKLVFMIGIAIPACAHPASVSWNFVSLERYHGTREEYRLFWGKHTLDSSFDLQVDMILSTGSGSFTLASLDYNDTATGVVDNWLFAGAGDLADASTTRNKSEYFNHCNLDHQTHWSNNPITGEIDTTFYLMFAVGDLNDYNNNIPNPACLYGWVSLAVDTDGAMRLIESAIDLDGDSIIVGAVPEPSGGLLLLFGAAALALKRRRRRG